MWTLGDPLHPAAGRTAAMCGSASSTGHGSRRSRSPGASRPRSPAARRAWSRGGGAQPVRRTVSGIVQAIAVSGAHVAVATPSRGPIEIYHARWRSGAGAPRKPPAAPRSWRSIPRSALLASGGQDRVIRVYRTGDAFAQIATLLLTRADRRYHL